MQNPPMLRSATTETGGEAAGGDDEIGRYLIFGRLTILLLVIIVGGWSAFSQISGAVIASGTVVVESNAKAVQHIDGGIISEIAVRDGDAVKAGDLMIRLDTRDLEEELVGLQAQHESKTAEIGLVTKQHASLTPLYKRKLVTESRMIALEREKAQLEGELGRIDSERAQVRAKLKRTEIRAPIDGHVHNLAFHTVGGVIGQGEDILGVVPSLDRLIIEAQVDPADVDQIAIGQTATIRLTNLDRRRTPELKGDVVHVSADLVRDEAQGTSYYTIRLNYEDDGQLGGHVLVPGMPAEVFVETGQRTVLAYLIKPLTDHIAHAFREE